MSKSFFYKDETGKIRKYYYCTRCEKGPYREDQINKEVFHLSENMNLFYCMSCIKELNIRVPGNIKKDVCSDCSDKESKERDRKIEETYSFEKKEMSNVVLIQFYDGTFLSVICNDIDKWLEEVKYTAMNNKLPVEVIYKERLDSKEAIQKKKYLDQLNMKQKYEFIKNFYFSIL